MPNFQHNKSDRADIQAQESMVRPRQDDGKKEPATIPPNELILINPEHLSNHEEIFNLINNHSRLEEIGPVEKSADKTIYHFTNPKRPVSLGRLLARSFKGATIKISWSKVNQEVKVFVDFSNLPA